jgi:HK97 family phage portal protein
MQKEYKAIVTIPQWAEEWNERYALGQSADDALLAPIIQRAIQIRANTIARAPVEIWSGDNEADWPFPVPLWQLLWKIEASLLVYGAAYVEKVRGSRSGRVRDLAFIPPRSIAVERMPTGEIVFRQGKTTFRREDIIYLHEPSLDDDYKPGISALQSATTDARTIQMISKFSENFFSGGAVPVTIVYAENATKPEVDRIESFFKRVMTGITNVGRLFVLNRKVEPKVVSQPLKDMAMLDLHERAVRNISYAFGIPEALLRYDPNRATAEEQRLSFYQDTIEPRANLLAAELNVQCLNEMGLELRFAFEKLDIYQEDEEKRANSILPLVQAITASPKAALAAMDILGFELSADIRARIEQLGAQPQAEAKPQAQPAQLQPAPVEQAQPADNPANKALADELDKWRRKAIKRLQKDGKADCPFESAVIPSNIRMRIARGLPACKTADDVDALFSAEMAEKGDAQAILEAVRDEIALLVSKERK